MLHSKVKSEIFSLKLNAQNAKVSFTVTTFSTFSGDIKKLIAIVQFREETP